jgi:NAD(P)-dependent dehydrogenase (short-subunit alcohol dehydrogenase family)
MDSLKDRTALVTGGGRGIGRAIALALASEGARVAVAARSVSEIEQVAAEIVALDRRAIFLPLDVSDRAALATLPERVAQELGPVDILVNNVGLFASGPVVRTLDAEWDALMAVNVTAPFLLSRACLPSMVGRGYGRIVNVSSVAGRTGLKNGAAYAASKHALIGLTRSLALEVARKGVTANAVCPGLTDTQMLEEAIAATCAATGKDEGEVRAALLAEIPLGRLAVPDEVAQAVVLCVKNGAMTGQIVQVDGGALLA